MKRGHELVVVTTRLTFIYLIMTLPQSGNAWREMATTTERLMFLLTDILSWQSFTNEAESKKNIFLQERNYRVQSEE
jgi:hypothetical protein